MARVSLELLGKGRTLADLLNVEVTAILIGEGVESQAEELISSGADRVIIADDPVVKDYRTEVYTAIIVDQVQKERPEILLIGGTCTGRDLAPRVAGMLHTGCITDCTELDIDQEMRLIVASKPYFGRNVMADIICPIHKPQIITVRTGIMELPEQDPPIPTVSLISSLVPAPFHKTDTSFVPEPVKRFPPSPSVQV